MPNTSRNSIATAARWLIAVLAACLIIAVAWATGDRWMPNLAQEDREHETTGHEHGDSHEEHAEHGHEHGEGGEANSIQLSDKALKNIGFEPVKIALGEFERTVFLPAIVIDQPGKTQINVASPLTGTISEIHVIAGEALEPGTPMFDIRLTHEEVVTAQRDFLLTSENLDIVNREIQRLQSIGEGVVAGKQVLEKQYEKQKLEAALLAGRQALLLHGLVDEQIDEIRRSKKLVQSMTIRAPAHTHSDDACSEAHLFHVQKLVVSRGQQVQAGQVLCVLADHCMLMVEGRAFEDDAKILRDAAREGWGVSASLVGGDGTQETIDGLKVLYLADQIDPESRAFHFYLKLPNSIIRDQTSPDQHRFIEWKFKPGQRMELSVPVEKWKDRIVLPVGAVIDEGAEHFVYRQNGNRFERLPIHEEYRDRTSVIIANDGGLFQGDVVAGAGAYQIHLALKNKSGGGVDPHAGHHH